MVSGELDFVRHRRVRAALDRNPALRARWDAAVETIREMTETIDEEPALILADAVKIAIALERKGDLT